MAERLQSFLEGVGSILDIIGSSGHMPELRRPNPRDNGLLTDSGMIRRDWRAVGRDLRKAMDVEAHEQTKAASKE
ncbi:MAG: hypothetical protein HY342_03340 [Candidatus Lambdaproteobacteria bacterium]|nr:hypothetical protein [Candidatus Lambdaproteobacteria bacterium]